MARQPIEIDRDKLRAAIRKLGDEYVFHMLDDAIDLLPPAKDALIATKQPKKYDEAIMLLRDLRDVCVRAGRQAEAATRIARLCEEHAKKPSLIERIRKTGLAT